MNLEPWDKYAPNRPKYKRKRDHDKWPGDWRWDRFSRLVFNGKAWLRRWNNYAS